MNTRLTLSTYMDHEPCHLVEVRWWKASPYSYTLSQHRAIFYKKRVAWSDHPDWKEEDGMRGADFVNEWGIEEQRGDGWTLVGRSSDGWKALGRYDPDENLAYQNFDTQAAARHALADFIDKSIASYERSIEELREARERLVS